MKPSELLPTLTKIVSTAYIGADISYAKVPTLTDFETS